MRQNWNISNWTFRQPDRIRFAIARIWGRIEYISNWTMNIAFRQPDNWEEIGNETEKQFYWWCNGTHGSSVKFGLDMLPKHEWSGAVQYIMVKRYAQCTVWYDEASKSLCSSWSLLLESSFLRASSSLIACSHTNANTITNKNTNTAWVSSRTA